MHFGPVFRVLGALLYGIVGYWLGIALAGTFTLNDQSAWLVWSATLGGAVLGFILTPWLIIAPARAARNSLSSVPLVDLLSGTAGLAIGLVIAALLSFPLSSLPQPFGSVLPFVGVLIFGYLGSTLMLLRQEDVFALLNIEPNKIRTRKSGRVVADGLPKMLLDTSVIIDGRIADIAQTGFLLSPVQVPRFVLNELQYIADSSDTLRRNRGRRGLEMLDRLQNNDNVEIQFIDEDPSDATQVDDKLISLAMSSGAAVVTNDYNLNRVAQLQGVTVLNINELANAVKSIFLPGEDIPLKIIQEGKEINQGVGYLDDGTMVVVENGRRFIDQEIPVQVTKVLQTNAGRLIFAVPNSD